MSRKRIFEDDGASSSVLSSPQKRTRHLSDASVPQTPIASAWSSSPSKRLCETPRTPYTPYPLHASDSPSNPFGRKRKERLIHSLPPVSSFKKHLSLRFQFVRRGVTPRMGGVYRTVRVPMNYTFTHLRSLIAWLFDTPAKYANGKAIDEEYLFEVKSKTSMYSPLYKPGQIKSGATTVKLSNVRDPGRWQTGYGFDTDTEEDELQSQTDYEEHDDQESQVEGEENMDEEWKWVDEEDFTIAHAWPLGLDPLISIIYYHCPDTQIHITINTTVLPRQRGKGNTPHVFNARGRLHLSPPPLPRPMFTKSVLHTLSSSPSAPPTDMPVNSQTSQSSPKKRKARPSHDGELTDTDADGEIDPDAYPFTSNHPFFQFNDGSPCKKPKREETVILVEDSEEEEDEDYGMIEDVDAQPKLSRWNEPLYAFALYFLQFMDPLGIPCDDVDASFFEEQTPYDPFEDDDDDEGDTQKQEEQEEEYENYEEEHEEDEEEEVIDLAESEREDEEGEDDEAEAAYEREDENEDDEDENSNPMFALSSTPALTYRDSSSLPNSSPCIDSSFSPSAFPFASVALPDPEDLSIILEEHYPNKKYSHTPAPPRARKYRLRIMRLERRLAKIKKTEFLTKYDEQEEDETTADADANVDQLDEEPQVKEEKLAEAVPLVKTEQEEDDWDPFGDEVDI